jgi:hypothetical protein
MDARGAWAVSQGTDSERLLAFYRGGGVDAAGRTLEQILAWHDDMLEYVHDYVQWLFPLRIPSSFHREAPILDDEVVRQFLSGPVLRRALVRSLDRMLTFYGLTRRETADGPIIERAASFEQRRKVWLWPNNHNHLRLTRIVTCLRELGLWDEARALRSCLMEIAALEPGVVTAATLRYWASA